MRSIPQSTSLSLINPRDHNPLEISRPTDAVSFNGACIQDILNFNGASVLSSLDSKGNYGGLSR